MKKTENKFKRYLKTLLIVLFCCCCYTGVLAQNPVVDSKGTLFDNNSKWTLEGTNLYNNNTGNVAVNVVVPNTPAAKLHVNGTMRIDSFFTGETPYVLVKDPNTENMAMQLVAFSSVSIGDIKNSFNANDHLGWVKMDGRATSTLSATQQTNAASLGYGTNLPDATDAYLSQDGGTFGTISGSNSVVLTKENMPYIEYSDTTEIAGNHVHRYTFMSKSVGSNTNVVANFYSRTTDVTSTDGAHAHTGTVSTGGSDTPVDITPPSLNTNTFIYLGL